MADPRWSSKASARPSRRPWRAGPEMRATRATDFAALAQQNQGAVGLVTVSFRRAYYNGTGFVITPDGYMLTNWHVVADSQHARPDTPCGSRWPTRPRLTRLRSSVVRTSMTAGIISRATEDVIQFDGMTIGGSSGSP